MAVAPDKITARCPECRGSIELSVYSSSVSCHRRSCRKGHRWAIKVTPMGPIAGIGFAHKVEFTPLKPGRTLAAAREDLIKEALRAVPQARRSEWNKASPAERAAMIKSYVEKHTHS